MGDKVLEQTHLQLLQPVLTLGRLALLALWPFDLAAAAAAAIPVSILLSGRPYTSLAAN
jgi:hypothetical protein